MINIWLDDIRPAPEHFIHVKTAFECIDLINQNQGNVNVLSLDHDLGDDELFGTGYNVVVYLEEKSFNYEFDFIPKEMRVHSQNNVGVKKMQTGITNIYNYIHEYND